MPGAGDTTVDADKHGLLQRTVSVVKEAAGTVLYGLLDAL